MTCRYWAFFMENTLLRQNKCVNNATYLKSCVTVWTVFRRTFAVGF
jgi:hypothetical protein